MWVNGHKEVIMFLFEQWKAITATHSQYICDTWLFSSAVFFLSFLIDVSCEGFSFSEGMLLFYSCVSLAQKEESPCMWTRANNKGYVATFVCFTFRFSC